VGLTARPDTTREQLQRLVDEQAALPASRPSSPPAPSRRPCASPVTGRSRPAPSSAPAYEVTVVAPVTSAARCPATTRTPVPTS